MKAIGYLYCDRYEVCGHSLLTRDEGADNWARAKGWHIWDGVTQGGKQTRVVLCNKCVESHRRNLRPAPPSLPGDQELPQLF